MCCGYAAIQIEIATIAGAAIRSHPETLKKVLSTLSKSSLSPVQIRYNGSQKYADPLLTALATSRLP